MIYTKEQLEAMSDLHLNRIIAFNVMLYTPDKSVLEHQDSGLCATNYRHGAVSIMPSGDINFHNYCNNPEDVMHLAFECGISLVKVSDGYVAFGDNYGYLDSQGTDLSIDSADDAMSWSNGAVGHANPLRAAAIVYILMKQGE